ncbi:hypothetical protein BBUCA8_03757 [Borreliella burgdorferi CA8]|nr:hypothetical protein BBUCA8_03757 [Borreliella burgdorferi CA8]
MNIKKNSITTYAVGVPNNIFSSFLESDKDCFKSIFIFLSPWLIC